MLSTHTLKGVKKVYIAETIKNSVNNFILHCAFIYMSLLINVITIITIISAINNRSYHLAIDSTLPERLFKFAVSLSRLNERNELKPL